MDMQIKSIISKHVDIALKIEDIHHDTTLDMIGVNSINFIRIVIEIEQLFGITFDVDYLGYEMFENVQRLVDYVDLLTKKGEGNYVE